MIGGARPSGPSAFISAGGGAPAVGNLFGPGSHATFFHELAAWGRRRHGARPAAGRALPRARNDHLILRLARLQIPAVAKLEGDFIALAVDDRDRPTGAVRFNPDELERPIPASNFDLARGRL